MEDMRARVSVGDRVVAVKTNGESVAGRLQRFGEGDLEIRIERNVTERVRRDENITLPHGAIQSFERKRDSSKGTLIGMAVGGGIAVTLFAAALAKDANEADEWGPGYVLFGALITGGGAWIGHSMDNSKPHLRYERSAVANLKFGAAPIYSRDRRGLRLVFTF
jgi:hypothetical protein